MVHTITTSPANAGTDNTPPSISMGDEVLTLTPTTSNVPTKKGCVYMIKHTNRPLYSEYSHL